MTMMAQDYLSEKVNYGGQACTRGQMIKELRETAPNERCVQMYLAGHSHFMQCNQVEHPHEIQVGDG